MKKILLKECDKMEYYKNSETTVKCAAFCKSIIDSVIVADILSATMHLATLYVRGASAH